MISPVKRTITYILFWLIASVTFAQDAEFRAEVDATKIIENSTVTVQFTLYNAEGTSFRPPEFQGLKKIGGPSQSSQMTFVNGRSTQQKSYGYKLLGTTPGTYKIGSASINVAGKKLLTKPITIEVIKASEATKEQSKLEGDVFLKAELSDSIAIIGQQITLRYVLYTNISIENYNLLSEPDYDGFFAVPMNSRRERPTREIINGTEYYKQTLQKTTLFPQQTGTYEYEPVIVSLGVSDGTTRARNSFFTRRNLKTFNRASEPITIKVISPPTDAPLTYSGGVGRYQMRAGVDKKSITTDDAIKINMIIKGTGDPKIVQAPDQDFGKNLDVYEPNILREDQYIDKGYVEVEKEFEYLIVPKKTGKFTIRPRFSFYNPDSSRYETLTAGPFTVNVAQGMKAINTLETLKAEKELAPLIPNPKYKSLPTNFYGSLLHWVILGLILSAIPCLIWYKSKLNKIANIDPRILLKQNAEKIAISKLSTAKSHMDAGDTRLFYDEIQKSIFGYLSDRIDVPYSKMNKADINNILANKNVPDSMIDHVSTVLQKAEMALFAGADSVDMQDSYEDAKQLILGLEAHFKK